MRVFFAVKFADYVKAALIDRLAEIKKHTLKGNFTEKDNFHITLVFVGECETGRIADLSKIIDNTVAKLKLTPIKANIGGLATFARPGEELLWAGVKTEPENILYNINKIIFDELANFGIKVNDDIKKFTPHVTLARKVEFWRISSKDLNQIKFEPINFSIKSLTLMESVQEVTNVTIDDVERRYTKIIYKPIYESKF